MPEYEKPNARYERRRSALEMEFESWKLHCQEIADNMFARLGRFKGRDTTPNDGKKRHQNILDQTAARALTTLQAGMHTGMTSPARQWFRLTLQDKDLADYYPVRVWLDDVRDILRYIFQKSNFYQAIHGQYGDLGAFGTQACIVEKDYKSVIRCYPFTFGEYYLACDSTMRVDTFYREYPATTWALVEKFGKDNVSTSVRNLYEQKKYDDWHNVVHLIEPNFDRRLGSDLSRDKAWRSVYYEEKADGGNLMRESGYNSFPLMAARWMVQGSDTYGHSPGMEVLAEVKEVCKIKEKTMVALDKVVDPPMGAPTMLKGKSKTMVPGGVTYFDAIQGMGKFEPLYEIDPNFEHLAYIREDVRKVIKQAFFEDLFLMLASSDRRQMTATEVVERHEEKLLALGPVVERIQPEMLDLAINRTFDIADEGGLIPDPPEELAGMEIEIEYVSLLAQAQKAVGITAIEQVSAFAGNLVASFPEVADRYNADEALKEYSEAVGAPAKIIAADKEVKRIRTARASQEEQQRQIAMAAEVAKGAETLSKANTGTNNALTALTGTVR